MIYMKSSSGDIYGYDETQAEQQNLIDEAKRAGWQDITANWPPLPGLDEAKAAGLGELESAFNEASQKAHCMSSAGFEIDADEIANRNIEGLVLVMQAGKTTLFRAYDNSFHEVTREQLEIMRKEIVINSQYLYKAKWTIEAQIMQAQTAQAVADIDISADTIAALADTLKAQAMEAANGEEGAGDAEAS